MPTSNPIPQPDSSPSAAEKAIWCKYPLHARNHLLCLPLHPALCRQNFSGSQLTHSPAAALNATIDRLAAEMTEMIETAKQEPVDVESEAEMRLQVMLEAKEVAREALRGVLEFVMTRE